MATHTHFDDRDANVECPACDELEDQAGGREGPDQPVRETFTGQGSWPCTCGHPKSNHYFGDQLDEYGRMHTSCQLHDGCHRFVPSPVGGGHDDYDHLRASADQARADAVRDRQIELGLGPDLFGGPV